MEYITFIFSIIIGVAALWFSSKFIRLYFRVKKWPKVEATVVSKEIFIHPKYSTSRTPYGLKASYVYQFNHSEYSGHMIYLVELANGQANHIKSDAERKLNTIKEKMPIYVNPAEPSQSVMFCTGIGLYLLVFCMGIFSLLIALSSFL